MCGCTRSSTGCTTPWRCESSLHEMCGCGGRSSFFGKAGVCYGFRVTGQSWSLWSLQGRWRRCMGIRTEITHAENSFGMGRVPSVRSAFTFESHTQTHAREICGGVPSVFTATVDIISVRCHDTESCLVFVGAW